jgi:hypothetical protein
MYAFLAAHWKPILSVGFIFGLLSLVLKFLDERLSQESKYKFNEWVDGLAIHLDDLRLPTMYNWIQAHRDEYLICSTFLYAVPLIIFLYQGSKTSDQFPFLSKQVNHAIGVAFLIIEIPLFTLGIFYILDNYLSQLSVAQSAKHYWKKALKAIVTIELFVMTFLALDWVLDKIPMVSHYINHYMPQAYELPNGTYLLHSLGLLAFIAVLSLFVGVSLFLPLLVIVFLQAPIATMSKAVWWLATYKKGAWAGLVFALTMLLSILGLFK